MSSKRESLNGYGVPTYLIEIDGHPVCMNPRELRNWLQYWGEKMNYDLSRYSELMQEAAKAVNEQQTRLRTVVGEGYPGIGDDGAELADIDYRLGRVLYKHIPGIIAANIAFSQELDELRSV